MTTMRWLVSATLLCSLTVGMTGCKGWFTKKRDRNIPADRDLRDNRGLDRIDEESVGETETRDKSRDAKFETGETVAATQFDTVLFAFDSAQVEDAERAKAEAVADFLKGKSGMLVVLEGHCDERGSAEYNVSLGERRAQAVRNYLMHLGIDDSRIQTKSFGAEKPKDPGHDENAWRINRRVEFVFIKP